MTPDEQAEEPEAPVRPKAVTVIGRIWLIGASFLFLVAVVDLVVWVVLQPAMPTILGYAAQRDPRLKLLSPLFEHYVAVKSVEAIFAAATGISAYYFLRLRGWARAAIEAATWISLAYFACFVWFYYEAYSRSAVAATPQARSRLLGAAGLTGLLAAGLVVMIALLHTRRVRAAFAAPPHAEREA